MRRTVKAWVMLTKDTDILVSVHQSKAEAERSALCWNSPKMRVAPGRLTFDAGRDVGRPAPRTRTARKGRGGRRG